MFSFPYPCGTSECQFPVEFCKWDDAYYTCRYCTRDICGSTNTPRACSYYCSQTGFLTDEAHPEIQECIIPFSVSVTSFCLNVLLIALVASLVLCGNRILRPIKKIIKKKQKHKARQRHESETESLKQKETSPQTNNEIPTENAVARQLRTFKTVPANEPIQVSDKGTNKILHPSMSKTGNTDTKYSYCFNN